MHKERLLRLAALLEKDAANENGLQFDLGGWGHTRNKAPSVSCGTQGCAVGLAAISGEFTQDGLTFYADRHYDCLLKIKPEYSVWSGWDAVEHFFEISYAEAHNLFDNRFYPTQTGSIAELAVAKRIREMVG